MKTTEWRYTNTGGGCTAIRGERAGFWATCLITRIDDPAAPHFDDEPCNLGVYDSNEELVLVVICASVHEAKAIFEKIKS